MRGALLCLLFSVASGVYNVQRGIANPGYPGDCASAAYGKATVSPNAVIYYPQTGGTYPNDDKLCLKFECGGTSTPEISFRSFQMASGDTVELYNTISNNDKSIWTKSGSIFPLTELDYAGAGYLFLQIDTNSFGGGQGFRVDFTCTIPPPSTLVPEVTDAPLAEGEFPSFCAGTQQRVYGDGNIEDVGNGRRACWLLDCPAERSVVVLRFSYLHVEHTYDSVSYWTLAGTEPVLIGRSTGEQSAYEVTLPAPGLLVYESDVSNPEEGFNLTHSCIMHTPTPDTPAPPTLPPDTPAPSTIVPAQDYPLPYCFSRHYASNETVVYPSSGVYGAGESVCWTSQCGEGKVAVLEWEMLGLQNNTAAVVVYRVVEGSVSKLFAWTGTMSGASLAEETVRAPEVAVWFTSESDAAPDAGLAFDISCVEETIVGDTAAPLPDGTNSPGVNAEDFPSFCDVSIEVEGDGSIVHAPGANQSVCWEMQCGGNVVLQFAVLRTELGYDKVEVYSNGSTGAGGPDIMYSGLHDGVQYTSVGTTLLRYVSDATHSEAGFTVSHTCVVATDAPPTDPPATSVPATQSPPTDAPWTPIPVKEGCVDFLVAGLPWYDSDGSTYNCVWYSELETRCGDYAEEKYRNTYLAVEACCHCGGGWATEAPDQQNVTDVPTQAPATSAPATSAPETFPCDDLTLANNATWVDSGGYSCTWYAAHEDRCEGFSNDAHRNVFVAKEACCVCNGGIRSTAVPPDTDAPAVTNTPPQPCRDKTFASGAEWNDNGGVGFGCAWYAQDVARCEWYSSEDFRNEHLAKEACCDCGGGLNETETNAPAPPTDAPATEAPQTDTTPPLTASPSTAVPAPEDNSTGCTDLTLASGAAWHDSGGESYNCVWYADSGSSRCEWYSGDNYRNEYVGSEACCACGGGSNATATPSTSEPVAETAVPETALPPPPTDAPVENTTAPDTDSPVDVTLVPTDEPAVDNTTAPDTALPVVTASPTTVPQTSAPLSCAASTLTGYVCQDTSAGVAVHYGMSADRATVMLAIAAPVSGYASLGVGAGMTTAQIVLGFVKSGQATVYALTTQARSVPAVKAGIVDIAVTDWVSDVSAEESGGQTVTAFTYHMSGGKISDTSAATFVWATSDEDDLVWHSAKGSITLNLEEAVLPTPPLPDTETPVIENTTAPDTASPVNETSIPTSPPVENTTAPDTDSPVDVTLVPTDEPAVDNTTAPDTALPVVTASPTTVPQTSAPLSCAASTLTGYVCQDTSAGVAVHYGLSADRATVALAIAAPVSGYASLGVGAGMTTAQIVLGFVKSGQATVYALTTQARSVPAVKAGIVDIAVTDWVSDVSAEESGGQTVTAFTYHMSGGKISDTSAATFVWATSDEDDLVWHSAKGSITLNLEEAVLPTPPLPDTETPVIENTTAPDTASPVNETPAPTAVPIPAIPPTDAPVENTTAPNTDSPPTDEPAVDNTTAPDTASPVVTASPTTVPQTSAPLSCAASTLTGYVCQDTSAGVAVHYGMSADRATVMLAIAAPVSGYASLGVGAGMTTAQIVLGFVKSGQATVYALTTQARSVPAVKAGIVDIAVTDWVSDVSAEESGGQTVTAFTYHMSGGKISDTSAATFVWATSDEDDLVWHSAKGSITLNLEEAVLPTPPLPDTETPVIENTTAPDTASPVNETSIPTSPPTEAPVENTTAPDTDSPVDVTLVPTDEPAVDNTTAPDTASPVVTASPTTVPQTSAPLSCAASTLTGYVCQDTSAGVAVHYGLSADRATVALAIAAPVSGYASLGVGAGMTTAQIVLGFVKSGQATVYALTTQARSVPAVKAGIVDIAVTDWVSDVSAEESGGQTVTAFTYHMSGGKISDTSAATFVWATSDEDDLVWHSAKGSITLNLEEAVLPTPPLPDTETPVIGNTTAPDTASPVNETPAPTAVPIPAIPPTDAPVENTTAPDTDSPVDVTLVPTDEPAVDNTTAPDTASPVVTASPTTVPQTSAPLSCAASTLTGYVCQDTSAGVAVHYGLSADRATVVLAIAAPVSGYASLGVGAGMTTAQIVLGFVKSGQATVYALTTQARSVPAVKAGIVDIAVTDWVSDVSAEESGGQTVTAFTYHMSGGKISDTSAATFVWATSDEDDLVWHSAKGSITLNLEGAVLPTPPLPDTETPVIENTTAPDTASPVNETPAPTAVPIPAIPQTDAPVENTTAPDTDSPPAIDNTIAPIASTLSPDTETPVIENTTAPDTDSPVNETPAPTAVPIPVIPPTDAPVENTTAPDTDSPVDVTLVPTDEPAVDNTTAPEDNSSTCTDLTLASGAAWHDSGGESYNCVWYGQTDVPRCEWYSGEGYRNEYVGSEACCACGGGYTAWNATTAPATSTPDVESTTAPQDTEAPDTELPWNSTSAPETSEPETDNTTSTPTSCTDLLLSSGAAWHDNGGATYNCAYYGAEPVNCERYSADTYRNEYVAMEACCVCGGGSRSEVSVAPDTDAPPLTTSVPNSDTPTPPAVTDTPLDPDTSSPDNETDTSFPETSEPEADNTTSTPESPVPTSCTDLLLSSGAAWHDNGGAIYNCAYYGAEPVNCERYSADTYRNEYVAMEACCVCGGGSRSEVSVAPDTDAPPPNSDTPTPPAVTDTPLDPDTSSPDNETDTSFPETSEPEADNTTSTPESPVPTSCTDLLLSSGAAWHDNGGATYNCAYYGAEPVNCERYSADTYRNEYVAMEACCVCGGGSRSDVSVAPDTDAPPLTTSAPETPSPPDVTDTPLALDTSSPDNETDTPTLPTNTPDTTAPVQSTVTPDTEAPYTTAPANDTASPDTASPDTNTPDTASPDTATPPANETDTPDTDVPIDTFVPANETDVPETAAPDTSAPANDTEQSGDTAAPDTTAPTSTPTTTPTSPPTSPPTLAPTASPTTLSPTEAPTTLSPDTPAPPATRTTKKWCVDSALCQMHGDDGASCDTSTYECTCSAGYAGVGAAKVCIPTASSDSTEKSSMTLTMTWGIECGAFTETFSGLLNEVVTDQLATTAVSLTTSCGSVVVTALVEDANVADTASADIETELLRRYSSDARYKNMSDVMGAMSAVDFTLLSPCNVTHSVTTERRWNGSCAAGECAGGYTVEDGICVEGDDDDLSGGAVVGIVIGSLACVACAVGASVSYRRSSSEVSGMDGVDKASPRTAAECRTLTEAQGGVTPSDYEAAGVPTPHQQGEYIVTEDQAQELAEVYSDADPEV